MQINMTTFAGRKQQYIRETLESLLASDWRQTNSFVNLMVGSEDQSHLQDYLDHPAVRIVPWEGVLSDKMRTNCTLNKIRALRYGGDGPGLTCEDDIIFPPNWFSSLSAAAAEMEGDDNYIMTLLVAIEHLAGARFVRGKTLVKKYPRYTLQGAQALYYPTRAIRLKLADYLETNLRSASGDDLIGRYARSYCGMYATKDSLVENIGAISCFHQRKGGRSS
jgi:hypothetical protein